jgi:hypothetical protein
VKIPFVHTVCLESFTIKKNEAMPFSGKWMELEIIILSEINQTRKAR